MSSVSTRSHVAAALTLAIIAVAVMAITSKCAPGPTAEAAAAAHAISNVKSEGFACASAVNVPRYPVFPGGSVVRMPLMNCPSRRCRKSCGGWDADAACASLRGKPLDATRRRSSCGGLC